MTMYIALIPGLIAVVMLMYSTPEKTFLKVYLPALILFPQVFVAEFVGLPDINFGAAALIPITVVTLVLRWNKWRLSLMDFLVFGFFAASIYSEFVNTSEYVSTDLRLVDTLLVDIMVYALLPYALGKLLIQPGGLTIKASKQIVMLVAVTCVIALYEWRFVTNLHMTIFDKFFPGQVDWIPQFRYGFARISASFAHPILFAMMIATALLLNDWLSRNGLWERKFRYFPFVGVSKQLIYFLVMIVGLLMTISRGPLASYLVGLLVMGAGFTKKVGKSLVWRFLIVLALGMGSYQVYQHYAAISYSMADETGSSAAYRTKLLEGYQGYIFDQPWWGYGYNTWPRVKGFESIDNHFLWLSLKHGMVTTGLLVSIFCFSMFRLLRRGIHVQSQNCLDSSFAITLFSIYFMLAVSLVTVYMGAQIEPVFFLLTGWTEGYLLSKPETVNQPQLARLSHAIGVT